MKLTATNTLILLGIAYIGYQTATGKPVIPPTFDLNPFDNKPEPTPATGTTFPLGKGSRGKFVTALQRHLGIKADGMFGTQTENALVLRHGKATVDSLEELNRWLGASTASSTPATLPTATTAPATTTKPTTTADPYGTFPLKKGSRGQYVRNLQKALGLKIDGIFGSGTEAALFRKTGQKVVGSLEQLNQLTGQNATPAAAPVATKPAATTVAPNWPELDKVFRAFWTPLKGFTNVASLRTFADKDAILAVLKPKTDVQLKAFIVQYNSAYKNWKGANKSRPTPTLAGDFSQLTIVGGSDMALLRDRVARLSIAR